ncbi:putative amino acid permease 7 [Zea mays]|uniref:Putative amino acid permease 7 n=1 Tax=Zea mays TaxID=4577 RepID=A0A1D6DVE0_MAIZE|nr:putative amino acid permease 7 [Zea mays]
MWLWTRQKSPPVGRRPPKVSSIRPLRATQSASPTQGWIASADELYSLLTVLVTRLATRHELRALRFPNAGCWPMAQHHGSHSLEVGGVGAGGVELDDDGHAARTGNLWTCFAHIITAVIGCGVLALSWSVAQLGWVGGPVAMLCFAFVTYLSAFLLSHCYRSPASDDGSLKRQRNYTYMDAVRTHLELARATRPGEKRTWLCGLFQYLNMYGTAIAYTITTATCLRAIVRANCYHSQGHSAPCGAGGDHLYMLLFGAAQAVLSLIPNFHSMAWLSAVAAVMSFTYATIGLGLGLAKTIENGAIKGSVAGVPMSTAPQKVWRVAQAIGDIAFAYPYTIVLLEIQDTLKSPPPESETMQKGNVLAVLATTFFYLAVGCFGYAAFGNAAPGNLLTGFGFYEPYWLIDFANACIVLHLLGGYQMFSQQIFTFADRSLAARFPNSAFVNKSYAVKVPGAPASWSYSLNLQRLCFRTAYVASTTGLALLFPYFNEVLGVLGAVVFWPLAIYLPVEMYCVQRGVLPWTRTWVALQAFSVVCFVVGTFAFVGSVEGVIRKRLG